MQNGTIWAINKNRRVQFSTCSASCTQPSLICILHREQTDSEAKKLRTPFSFSAKETMRAKKPLLFLWVKCTALGMRVQSEKVILERKSFVTAKVHKFFLHSPMHTAHIVAAKHKSFSIHSIFFRSQNTRKKCTRNALAFFHVVIFFGYILSLMWKFSFRLECFFSVLVFIR